MRLVVLILVLALVACDRNTEPFVPGEKPRAPDLLRIFPETDDRGRPVAAPSRAGLQEPDPVASARGTARAAPIRGTVQIAPELSGQVPKAGVLFVIARHRDAGPPLAVKRIASPRFPLEFRVGPEDVMVPSFEFSGEIRLSARLDGDGNAAAAAGDLAGQASGAYSPGSTGVTIVLDRRL